MAVDCVNHHVGRGWWWVYHTCSNMSLQFVRIVFHDLVNDVLCPLIGAYGTFVIVFIRRFSRRPNGLPMLSVTALASTLIADGAIRVPGLTAAPLNVVDHFPNVVVGVVREVFIEVELPDHVGTACCSGTVVSSAYGTLVALGWL